MFNVCPECGQYFSEKIIDLAGPYAICPSCKYKQPLKMLPLYCVIGACGSGKSKMCVELSQATTNFVVIESDILWREEFVKDKPNYLKYKDLCLRVCKNISQAGKSVIICGGSVPGQYEKCVESRYFPSIDYVALVCDSNVLKDRLKNRPIDRASGEESFINSQIKFNEWLKGDFKKMCPKAKIVNTTHDSPKHTAQKILCHFEELSRTKK